MHKERNPNQHYIPHMAVAEDMVEDDASIEPHLQELNPFASQYQIDRFKSFMATKLRDAIVYGVEISDYPIDPIHPIDAYRFGAEENRP